MTEDGRSNDDTKAAFTALVMMLSSSAMQSLGKMVNPLTNKAEVNLEGAQFSIDMLAMLREKTKGNLDKEEEGMLGDVLASLQLNFVETRNSVSTAGSGDKAEEKKAEEPRDPAGEKDEKGEAKNPKYHKSYGA